MKATLLLLSSALGLAGCATYGAVGSDPSESDGGGADAGVAVDGGGMADGGAGTDAGTTDGDGGSPATDAGEPCGPFSGYTHFNCSADGMSRLKCSNGVLVTESCDRGCLIRPLGEDDACMGTDNSWSCEGTMGTTKMEDGRYYATAFGCWTDAQGTTHTDPGDNCIPACLTDAQQSGLCAGLSGPDCEMAVNWFSADSSRFGCLARLRVTNPANGKSAVVVVLDAGPACWVERSVSGAILDLSGRVNRYLFGSDQGASDRTEIQVVEVSRDTPLGPVP